MYLGHWYQGDWVDGKMDGQGEFHHREGHVLQPVFKNNLYFMTNQGGTSIVPFKTMTEISVYLRSIKQFQDKLEKQAT